MVVTVFIIILLATVLVIAALVAAGRADAAMEARSASEPAMPQDADASDMHRHAIAESDPEPSLHVEE